MSYSMDTSWNKLREMVKDRDVLQSLGSQSHSQLSKRTAAATTVLSLLRAIAEPWFSKKYLPAWHCGNLPSGVTRLVPSLNTCLAGRTSGQVRVKPTSSSLSFLADHSVSAVDFLTKPEVAFLDSGF